MKRREARRGAQEAVARREADARVEAPAQQGSQAAQDVPAQQGTPLIKAAALCLLSVGLLSLMRLLLAFFPLPAPAALAVQALATLLCVLLPAASGLFVLDGNRTDIVRAQVLAPAQIRLYAITGLLAVFPALLVSGAVAGVLGAFGMSAGESAVTAPEGALFLPLLLCELLLAPICEELFFRGYLLGAFESSGKKTAVLAVSLAFALAHGLGTELAAQFLMGLLFALLTLRADSVLAAMLAHGCYNGALILLAYMGLGSLVGGTGLVACALQLAGTAAFCAALKQALRLRPCRKRAQFFDERRFSRRELLLFGGALAALIVSQIVTALLGVMA